MLATISPPPVSVVPRRGIVPPGALSPLRRMRRAAGLTLRQVARAAGVSNKATVSRWESGAKRPLPKRLPAIAAALGVEPHQVEAAVEAQRVAIENARARIMLERLDKGVAPKPLAHQWPTARQ